MGKIATGGNQLMVADEGDLEEMGIAKRVFER